MLGVDSTGRTTFFMWESADKEFETSFKVVADQHFIPVLIALFVNCDSVTQYKGRRTKL